MPTYEYACRDCGEQLEIVQSFNDDPLTECPSCQGGLRKVFSPVGISFKGSGFYKTDSRPSKSGAKTGTSTSKDSSGADSGSDSGSSSGDAKPTEKAGTKSESTGASTAAATG